MKKLRLIDLKKDLATIGGELSSRELSKLMGGESSDATFGLVVCCIGGSTPTPEPSDLTTPLPGETSESLIQEPQSTNPPY